MKQTIHIDRDDFVELYAALCDADIPKMERYELVAKELSKNGKKVSARTVRRVISNHEKAVANSPVSPGQS